MLAANHATLNEAMVDRPGDCELYSCRTRVCEIVAKLLNEAVDASCRMSSALLEKVQHAMLVRIKDTVSATREGELLNQCCDDTLLFRNRL